MKSSLKKSTNLRVVTVGGGTGTFPVVQALVTLNVDITCVVAISDSGGSSGRIRDEFGFQPVGDLRQSLAALARLPSQEWIQKLLLYRFEKGKGLEGHNLGNLLLTALQDMTGSTTQALSVAETLFHLGGRVVPASDAIVDLLIRYKDGKVVIGQDFLNQNLTAHSPIASVSLIPKGKASTAAITAIRRADWVILGPGDLYGSVMAVLAAQGLPQSIQSSSAKIMSITNLMTRKSQTLGFSALEHLQVIEKVIARPIDYVLINSEPIPKQALQLYTADHEKVVEDDLLKDPRVLRAPLLNTHLHSQKKADSVKRSLLRHDAEKLAVVFKKVFWPKNVAKIV